MKQIIREYKKDPRIRLFAGNLVSGINSKAWLKEIQAVFNYVRSHVRYTQDVTDIETIQTPDATIELGYGDCDDMSVLICALLESIGHSTRLVAAGFNPDDTNEFEHVWPQVYCPENGRGGGDWLSCDATENHAIGWEPEDIATWIIIHN